MGASFLDRHGAGTERMLGRERTAHHEKVRLSLIGAVSRLGLLIALGGCSVGPTFTKADATLPQTWKADNDPEVTTNEPVQDEWWTTLGDPNLDQLIALAASQNLPLQIAGLRIVESRAQWEIAQGRQFPQVQLAIGSFSALGLPQQFSDFTGFDRNILAYDVAFDAAWEIDIWGKYRRGVEAETATNRAAVAEREDVFVALAAEIARAYVALRTFETLVELARGNAAIQEESLRIANARFKNGATSELDPTQAATLLESTRATIPPLEFEVQAARNALSTLLGQPPGAVEQLLKPAGIPQAPTSVPVGLPADLVRRRPDVRRAEELAAAQSARVGVAKSELYPALTIVGQVGLLAFTGGQTNSNLFSSDAFNYTVGPRIAWPIFNYGRLTGGVRVQDARFQELLVEYRQTALKAVQEVEDALVRFRNARAALVLEQKSVEAAQRSVKLAQVQYREGAVDFQRVLDSQRSLLAQQNSTARTSASVVTGLISLHKALGGGWSAVQNTPLVPEPVEHEMRDRTGWGDLFTRPRVPEHVNHPQGGE